MRLKWRLLRSAILGPVAVLGLAIQAQAQPIPMSPELKAFLTRPDQQQTYNSMLAEQWRLAVENCPSPAMRGLNVVIGVPPKFDASGTPVSGQWRVVGQIEGCGKTRTMSILYAFNPDGRMARVGLLPGTTKADLRLQRDAMMYAGLGMVPVAPKDCKDVKVSDTKFVAFDGANPPTPADFGKRSWTEEWTVRSCGVSGLVTMHFMPDATGTAISAQLNKAGKVEP